MESDKIKIEVGKRLKEIRRNAGYSQTDLFKIEIRKKGLNLELLNDKDFLDKGKQTISQIERGTRSLTLERGIIYADIFNVSLDYLYCRTEYQKPEYKELKNVTGLSDNSINKLEYIKNNSKQLILMLDKLLSSKMSSDFIELLSALNEHTYIEIKNRVSQFPGSTYLLSNNIKGEYKRPIILKQNDLEYISLFKITELIKRIAYELKQGEK